MKAVLTSREVFDAEQKTISAGTDVKTLRTRAAKYVVDRVLACSDAENGLIAVFCGCGGNGIDGVVAASILHGMGKRVTAYLAFPNSASVLAAVAESGGLDVRKACDYKGGADIIVDALFGIGLNRPIEGEVAELINKLNGETGYKIAVDIPSGLSDSGKTLGAFMRADETVTFSCYKRGMLFGDGINLCGRIRVCDIGVRVQSDINVYEDADFPPHKRRRDAHKGSNGKIFIIGGCGTMIGAPMLAAAAAHAATLNGAGTVTVCVPEIDRVAIASRSTLAMMKFMPDTIEGFIRFDKPTLDDIITRADAIAIGMGMGAAPDLKKILRYIAENYDGKLIIDADALNSVKDDHDFLRDSRAKIVVTPHVGEFKRFTGLEASIENAKHVAADLNLIVALKSATTIVTDGCEARINISGTPALAKGGSGDVLAGCIAALACSFDMFDAATIACYRNGIGAERAVSSYAELMLTPYQYLKYADYKEI